MQQIIEKKYSIYDSFGDHKKWYLYESHKCAYLIKTLSSDLAEYFTKFTDYMVNSKIMLKDMALIKQFLEPFRWQYGRADEEKLGGARDLVCHCLRSVDFWGELRNNH